MTKSIVRVVVLVILTAAWVRAVEAQREHQVLTLAQAVNEALVNNDRIVNQRDSVEQAALGVRLARNNFQPKIVPNIQGSFGRTNVSNQVYRVDLTQRFTTGTEMRLGVGTSTAQIPAAPFPGDIRSLQRRHDDELEPTSPPGVRSVGGPSRLGHGGPSPCRCGPADAAHGTAGHDRRRLCLLPHGRPTNARGRRREKP